MKVGGKGKTGSFAVLSKEQYKKLRRWPHPFKPQAVHSSLRGQGRELNTKAVSPVAPGPAGDAAPGAWLLGKSSTSLPQRTWRLVEAPGYH